MPKRSDRAAHRKAPARHHWSAPTVSSMRGAAPAASQRCAPHPRCPHDIDMNAADLRNRRCSNRRNAPVALHLCHQMRRASPAPPPPEWQRSRINPRMLKMGERRSVIVTAPFWRQMIKSTGNSQTPQFPLITLARGHIRMGSFGYFPSEDGLSGRTDTSLSPGADPGSPFDVRAIAECTSGRLGLYHGGSIPWHHVCRRYIGPGFAYPPAPERYLDPVLCEISSYTVSSGRSMVGT